MENEFIKYLYLDSVKGFDDFYVNYTHEEFHNHSNIKPIAFYLPQYYPTNTNNENWGNGFTEWSNVIKGIPSFIGHYQPHIPEALGFYDLRMEDIFIKQIHIAKEYGVYGFCFYLYDFGGHQELRMPINKFCSSKYDFPFCLCWANEHWSRRWNGKNEDILIEQIYSQESILNFIESIIPYLKEKNYIKVGKSPLLLIYNPRDIPNLKEVASIWNERCKLAGIPSLYLVYCRTFHFDINPKTFDFQAAVDFPPHNCEEKNIRTQIEIANPYFTGSVIDACSFVNHVSYDNLPYVFPGTFPSWDNTARRGNTAKIFINTTPDLFKCWIKKCIYHLKSNFTNNQRFLFINGWNEWGEGAHLEPDQKYGYAYLEQLRQCLNEEQLNDYI